MCRVLLFVYLIFRRESVELSHILLLATYIM